MVIGGRCCLVMVLERCQVCKMQAEVEQVLITSIKPISNHGL